jgi:hypothetical protein
MAHQVVRDQVCHSVRRIAMLFDVIAVHQLTIFHQSQPHAFELVVVDQLR